MLKRLCIWILILILLTVCLSSCSPLKNRTVSEEKTGIIQETSGSNSETVPSSAPSVEQDIVASDSGTEITEEIGLLNEPETGKDPAPAASPVQGSDAAEESGNEQTSAPVEDTDNEAPAYAVTDENGDTLLPEVP